LILCDVLAEASLLVIKIKSFNLYGDLRKMPIPQNSGSAWSYHWEPKIEHKLEPEKAKAPHTTISHIKGVSLIKSCFNGAYYVKEDSGNLWFLGSFETDKEANEAFGRWTKCH
jgi:hypothetical protein